MRRSTGGSSHRVEWRRFRVCLAIVVEVVELDGTVSRMLVVGERTNAASFEEVSAYLAIYHARCLAPFPAHSPPSQCALFGIK